VKQIINQEYQTIKSKGTYPYFVAEIPLLFEIGMENEFDTVIAVVCDEKIAKDRSQHFGNSASRSNRQLSTSIKAAKADFVITNNGDLNLLRTAVQKLVQQLRTENQ
jgi:dephospho-CoA kinase